MRPCLTLHPGPVVAYVVILHRDDGTRSEYAPLLDYARAEALGRLSLTAPGVVTYAVQTRLAERPAA